jgi:orotidine-5'-phosphate decarboxylase
MFRLEPGMELPAEHMLVLAADTDRLNMAERYTVTASRAGALIVKYGLEIVTNPDITLRQCSELAADNQMEWLADAKLYGTSKTLPVAINNYTKLKHPPVGITVSTHSGIGALRLAQEVANKKNIMLFGVGHLSTVDEEETKEYYKMSSQRIMIAQATRAVNAKMKGMVTSGSELALLKSYKHTKQLFTLVVGTRSEGIVIEGDDQKRKTTIIEAVAAGGDLIETGRQVTDNKTVGLRHKAMQAATRDVEVGLRRRAA